MFDTEHPEVQADLATRFANPVREALADHHGSR